MVSTKPQCEFCAFYKLDDQSTPEKGAAVEEKIRALRRAKDAPKKPRVIYASFSEADDRTYTCKADSSNWPKQLESDESCEDFIENDISLAEALGIRETKGIAKAINRHHWYEKSIGIIEIAVFSGLV